MGRAAPTIIKFTFSKAAWAFEKLGGLTPRDWLTVKWFAPKSLAPQVAEVERLVVTGEGLAAKGLPDSYAGIRQASQYLKEMGVPRAKRVEILQSFEAQNMVVKQAGQTEFGLRYFSDANRAGGSYLFETFPASRSSLAIKPEWNTMSGFRQFQVRPGVTVLEGRAAAQGANLPGGQGQKFILDWRNDLIAP